MSYIGINSIGKLLLGTTEMAKAYLGMQLVYQSGSGPTPQNYVTDGLVFRVDGIASASGVVKDLVSGETFDVNIPASVSFADGAIVFNGGCLYRTSGALGSNADYTIEICFSPDNLSNHMNLFSVGENSSSTYLPMVLVSQNSGVITYVGRRGGAFAPSLVGGGKYTISMNASRGIQNGVSLNTATTNYYTNTANYTVIGARRYNNAFSAPFYGKIYAIRVYSRQLAEAEMLNNQTVDNVRFNLGLSI